MNHAFSKIFVAAAALGANFQAFAYTLNVSLSPTTPMMGKQTVNLNLMDGKKPASGMVVKLTAIMPAMPGMSEMKSTAKVTSEKPGIFVGKVNLSMEGVWYLDIAVTSKKKTDQYFYKLETGKPGLEKITEIPKGTTNNQMLPMNNEQHHHHH